MILRTSATKISVPNGVVSYENFDPGADKAFSCLSFEGFLERSIASEKCWTPIDSYRVFNLSQFSVLMMTDDCHYSHDGRLVIGPNNNAQEGSKPLLYVVGFTGANERTMFWLDPEGEDTFLAGKETNIRFGLSDFAKRAKEERNSLACLVAEHIEKDEQWFYLSGGNKSEVLIRYSSIIDYQIVRKEDCILSKFLLVANGKTTQTPFEFTVSVDIGSGGYETELLWGLAAID